MKRRGQVIRGGDVCCAHSYWHAEELCLLLYWSKPHSFYGDPMTCSLHPPLVPGLLISLRETMVMLDPLPIQSSSSHTYLYGSIAKRCASWTLATVPDDGFRTFFLPLLKTRAYFQGYSSSITTGASKVTKPRGLILAPTHELSWQLSGFAKSLLHEIKLRVLLH